MAMTGLEESGRRERPGASAAERRAWGRSRRELVPRVAFSVWAPPRERRDPVAVLLEPGAGRIPEPIERRADRLTASPLSFFCGGAAVMASDLASLPSSGIVTQACGDAHLLNFTVQRLDRKRAVLDLADFDETCPAPFEWDLLRLGAGIQVAGLQQGFPTKATRAAVAAAMRRYRTTIARLATAPALETWRSITRVEGLELPRRDRAGATLGELAHHTERTEAGWRIRESPPHVIALEAAERTAGGTDLGQLLRTVVKRHLASLRPDLRAFLSQHTLADVARKRVGFGAAAEGSFLALLVGPQGDDLLFLQLKEAGMSALEPFASAEDGGSTGHHGERVVTGQRLLQAVPDELLGWLRVDDLARPLDLYVRRLRDGRSLTALALRSPAGLELAAGACGEALARAHARAGHAPEIAGYLGGSPAFDVAVAGFARAYAAQVIADYEALLETTGL